MYALTRARHRLYIGFAAPHSDKKQQVVVAPKSALSHLLKLKDIPAEEWNDVLEQHSGGRPQQFPVAFSTTVATQVTSYHTVLKRPPTLSPYKFSFYRTHSFSSLSKSDEDHFISKSIAMKTSVTQETPVKDTPDLLQTLGEAGAILGDALHTVLEEYLGNRRSLADAIGPRENSDAWLAVIPPILNTPIDLRNGPRGYSGNHSFELYYGNAISSPGQNSRAGRIVPGSIG